MKPGVGGKRERLNKTKFPRSKRHLGRRHKALHRRPISIMNLPFPVKSHHSVRQFISSCCTHHILLDHLTPSSHPAEVRKTTETNIQLVAIALCCSCYRISLFRPPPFGYNRLSYHETQELPTGPPPGSLIPPKRWKYSSSDSSTD